MSRELTVARTDELQDGQMKQIEVGEQLILLVRMHGEYRALGGTCPHHGAPLADGTLKDGHVRCPWHQSVFDALSGRLIEPPALDDLPRFELRIEGDEIIVTVPDEIPLAKPMRMARPDPATDGRVFVIVGSGAAGFSAAETLRQDGFQGRIVMLARDRDRPYDRTELSKQYLAKPDAASQPFVRPETYYAEHGIELRAGVEVTRVDPDAHAVTTAEGEQIAYDELLLATGSVPRTLGVPGEDLDNVFVLRSLADCERIRQAAGGGGRAVIVGASFIGMEVASSLKKWGVESTIIAPDEVPFARVFGERIGEMFQAVQQDNGVAFRLGRKVARFDGQGRVRAVELQDGERLEADLVVVGIGVRQQVNEILDHHRVSDAGTVEVDDYLRITDNVRAAGDIAVFPDWRTAGRLRIEHWRLAMQLGRYAAHNMAGQTSPYRAVPFFWTNQHKTIVQYIGHAHEWDEIIFEGSPEERQFLAYYISDGRVAALAGCKQDRRIALAGEIIRAEGLPTLDRMRAAMA